MDARKGLGALAAAALLAAPAAAPAQVELAPAASAAGSALPDPDAVIVQELVVTARDRGPAWWSVSNGASTVYILGAPSIAPIRAQWDTITLERRLQGASAVILPYRTERVKVGGAIGAAWNYMRLRSARPFEAGLDPALQARFAAARAKLGKPASRYMTGNGLAAGIALHDDYREVNRLTNADTEKVVKVYAQKAGVKVVQQSYALGPLLGAMVRTPKAAGLACLQAVMEQVEAGPGVTLAATRAWAGGDTAGALGNERTYERCFAAVPGAAQFDARTKADQVRAIEAALQQPGHALAVVQLRPLLSQGGVLDQLRAKGYLVHTPGEQ